MGLHQVADVDDVPDTAAVRRRIIGSEHIDLGALAGGGFDRDLQQMRGPTVARPNRGIPVAPGSKAGPR
jgi:hypothetical protein